MKLIIPATGSEGCRLIPSARNGDNAQVINDMENIRKTGAHRVIVRFMRACHEQ